MNDSKKDEDEDEEIENKEKNGSIENEKKVTDDKEKKESGKEAKEGEDEVDDDENVVALAEIDKINENINKTRVDGLQTLHTVRTFALLSIEQQFNFIHVLDLFRFTR